MYPIGVGAWSAPISRPPSWLARNDVVNCCSSAAAELLEDGDGADQQLLLGRGCTREKDIVVVRQISGGRGDGPDSGVTHVQVFAHQQVLNLFV